MNYSRLGKKVARKFRAWHKLPRKRPRLGSYHARVVEIYQSGSGTDMWPITEHFT